MPAPITSGPGSTSASGANPAALAAGVRSGNVSGSVDQNGNYQAPGVGETMVNGQLTYVGNDSSGNLLPIPKPDPSAVNTPIIGPDMAKEHYNSVQTNTANIANGVAGQAATNAANQAAAAQSAAGNTGTGGGSTPQGGNQPAGGGTVSTQDSSTSGAMDNSDLTGALNSATDALNAGNGITPPDKTALANTESTLSDEAKTINDSLTQINSDLSSAVSGYQNNLAKIQNGTFPLTPAQQALLDQTKSAMDSLVQSAQTQAQLYAQVATTLGARTGLEEFQPGVAIQGVTNAVAKGAAAIADAQFKGVTALAQVQKDIQDEDTTNITDSYNALTKSLDSQQAELEKMATDVQTQAKDAQDEFDKQMTQYTTQVQDSISNAFKAQTLTDDEKKTVFDEAMANKNFDEKQKQDLVDNYYKGVTAAHEAGTLAIAQENADTNRAKLINDQSAASQSALNALKTTPSGNKYVDGQNLDAAGKAAALAAGQIVLEGDSAKTMSFLTDTETQLSGVLSALQTAGLINPDGTPNDAFTGTAFGGKTMPVSYFNNGSAKDSIKSFNDGLANTITELKKLPGTGDLVNTLQGIHLDWNASPKDFMTTFDTVATDLKGQENSLLTTGSTPQEGATGTINGKSATFTNGQWVY